MATGLGEGKPCIQTFKTVFKNDLVSHPDRTKGLYNYKYGSHELGEITQSNFILQTYTFSFSGNIYDSGMNYFYYRF